MLPHVSPCGQRRLFVIASQCSWAKQGVAFHLGGIFRAWVSRARQRGLIQNEEEVSVPLQSAALE